MELPGPVAALCVTPGALRGVEAVAIGGSRATGTADAASDWDIGLYYRAARWRQHSQFTLVPPSSPALADWVNALRGQI